MPTQLKKVKKKKKKNDKTKKAPVKSRKRKKICDDAAGDDHELVDMLERDVVPDITHSVYPPCYAPEDLNCAFLREKTHHSLDRRHRLEAEIERFSNFDENSYFFHWVPTNPKIPKSVEFLETHTFTILSEILKIAHTTPASTGNLERFFSDLKRIYTAERSSMTDETLTKQFFLHGRSQYLNYLLGQKK
ncbi:unnamed protein product [Oikopleura dioica]|uniref:HAT C-terminal dimerisation domain-containing protein n=1 Tax=Oikopleura dioica TaxID=34765 RepID=E4YDG7_OIKDI|nr:unnamed protein product [Oikopleura dioica]